VTPPHYKYVCNHLVLLEKIVSTKIVSKCYIITTGYPFYSNVITISGRGKRCFCPLKCWDWFWGPLILLFSGSVPSGKAARVRLTTHLYLVLRSRMGEATPSLPLYTFMVCTQWLLYLYIGVSYVKCHFWLLH
jgi:hypothetical protein